MSIQLGSDKPFRNGQGLPYIEGPGTSEANDSNQRVQVGQLESLALQ